MPPEHGRLHRPTGPVSYTHLDVYKRQVLGTATGGGSQGTGSKRTLHHVCVKEGSERKMNDDEKCCCGNCLHHRPSWETGHLSGWHCDNFMADAYGCDTEYDDGEECPDFESKR